MKTEILSGWALHTYDGMFAPTLEGDKGVWVEIDDDDDLAIEFDDERKAGYVPMKAIHALINAKAKGK